MTWSWVCRPEDVDELLARIEGPFSDANGPINKLYGQPTLKPEELAVLKEVGIRELRQWQNSLEELGGQTWS